MSASHPLAGFMSQSANPTAQGNEHVPVVQVGVTFIRAPTAHAPPHVPQCIGLVCVSISQPSVGLMLQ